MFEEAVEGRLPASHGADVSFSLTFRCPLDATELERHRVTRRDRSTVRACPYGHGRDYHGVKGVRKAVCMPPVGAAFALEKRGARGLVACSLVAGVSGARDVVNVEFGVADVVKDILR